MEKPDPAIAKKILWAFEQDEKTGFVTIVPMDSERIVIHGKQEAEMFCNTLIQCFQLLTTEYENFRVERKGEKECYTLI